MQSLLSQETGLANCQNHYTQLESSIIQRLKWAAGANPSLNLVLTQFEDCSSYRKHVFEVGYTVIAFLTGVRLIFLVSRDSCSQALIGQNRKG